MTSILDALCHIEETLSENLDTHWTLAFSGGKDSSALLCLVYDRLRKFEYFRSLSLEVLYCDTRTENPIIDAFAKKFLSSFSKEANSVGLPLRISIVSPSPDRTYLSRVIGRGYPPPTNSFRWCTQELRIRPVEKHLAKFDNAIVALGVRENESKQRDRFLSSYEDAFWMPPRNASKGRRYYTPVRRMTTEDVWDAIFFTKEPLSLDRSGLWNLYADAGGECPIVRSADSSPCASGRFGCWTCTVVRRDRSGENLLSKGYAQMSDFLNFRKLLLDVRNDPTMRWPRRRSGVFGFGPLSLAARKMLLSEIDALEIKHAIQLLDPAERMYIAQQWADDLHVEYRLPLA